jgi:hypothetical protein
MKKTMLIVIGLLNLVVCRAQSDYVILKDQQTINELISTYKIIPETAKTTELSKAEFNLVEKTSKECIENYNAQIVEGFKKRGENRKNAKMYQIMELKNYKIQYVPYLNEKGQKEIWINGFCDDFDLNWKKEIIFVHDGGNCYFTIQLNLSTGQCLEIVTNGYA